MEKMIYLVRNVEAIANIEKRFCQNSKLTKNGEEHAKLVGTVLKGTSISGIYNSSLIHAEETANEAVLCVKNG